jgi:uncharacterized repeat protein (TIGR01451 family)
MLSRKSFLSATLCVLFISNTSNAAMCPRLKSVAAGEVHTLALADDSTLWACGDNNWYQLGLSSSVPEVHSLKQVKGENGVGYLKNVVTYDAGWKHSLAADVNGTLWSWGWDDVGQLGNGPSNDPCYFPTKVHGVNNVGYLNHIVCVSAGRTGSHSLAVDSNGYVYAWGSNASGQCGDGNTVGHRDYPVLVWDSNSQTTGRYLGDETHVIAVDAGVKHSLALDANCHVWHWGYNSYNGSYPEKVKTSSGEVLSNIVQISSCSDYSIAVDSNGNVWEWTSSDSAYKIPGGEMGTTYLEDIVEVSVGGYSMARTSDGYVLVWYAGQSYAYPPEYTPDGEMNTLSGLLEGIISINAGYGDYKLAVCENGFGWAWGTNNSYGQFGVGDTNSRPEPAQMLCAADSNSILMTKTDEIQGSDPNCAYPGDEITYTITYDANGHSDTNVMIIDYLPPEVDYNSSSPDGNYNAAEHICTWYLPMVPPDGSGAFTLTVKVNNWVEPGRVITNRCELIGDNSYSFDGTRTSVCEWNPGVIYVDCDRVQGHNTGMSWEDAYLHLHSALNRARAGCGSEIWVAEGTYKPSGATFQLAAGIPVYGHFAGNETSLGQRNLKNPNNETILTSDYNVVTASNFSQGAILDGFTVTGASTASVKIEQADLEVRNCLITGSGRYGIVATSSNFTVIGCTIKNNANYGISAVVSSFTVADCNIHNNLLGIYSDFANNNTLPETRIEDGIIHNNSSYGIYLYRGGSLLPVITGCKIFSNSYQGGAYTYPGIGTYSASATITNNWIYDNNGTGISVYLSPSPTTIRNNTIVNNNGDGIYSSSGATPVITSSIIWGNYKDLRGCTASYSWLDANGDPGFVDTNDPNDFHLGPNSPCIDAGDPNFTDSNEADIDGECRIMFGKTALRVDIGADEHFWPKADFNRDGIVNFFDYALFACHWHTPYADVNLAGDIDIEIDDLAAFCDDWLWIAPWSDLYKTLMSQGGDGMAMQSMAAEAAIPESLESAQQQTAESADLPMTYVEQPVETEALMVERLVNWLDDVWLTGGLSEVWTEQEYLAFRQSIAESVEAE